MTETILIAAGVKRRWNPRGMLRAAPGLIAPAALLAWSVGWFAQEVSRYYSLPAAERAADGSPLSPAAGPFFAGVAIVCTLLLFVAPLLAALPSRLRVREAVVALVLQVLPLWIALGVALGDSWYTTLGWLAFVGFAYVPALAVVRLTMQRRSAPRRSISEG
jgi:hypothetical protein